MSRFAWSHNAYYHGTLLRLLPARCEEVLDVGCGAGTFATALADRARHVDALDRSAEMIAAAKQMVPGNVGCLHADFLLDDAVPTGHRVREHARAVLPGAEVWRLLSWRSLLAWRKPPSQRS